MTDRLPIGRAYPESLNGKQNRVPDPEFFSQALYEFTSVTAAYRTFLTEKYTKHPNETTSTKSRRAIISEIDKWDDRRDKLILSLGAGNGRYEIELARQLRDEYGHDSPLLVVTTLNEVDLDGAKILAHREGLSEKVIFMQLDACDVLNFFGKDSIDGVIQNNMGHHIKNWEHVFWQINEIMKPGAFNSNEVRSPGHYRQFWEPKADIAKNLSEGNWAGAKERGLRYDGITPPENFYLYVNELTVPVILNNLGLTVSVSPNHYQLHVDDSDLAVIINIFHTFQDCYYRINDDDVPEKVFVDPTDFRDSVLRAIEGTMLTESSAICIKKFEGYEHANIIMPQSQISIDVVEAHVMGIKPR